MLKKLKGLFIVEDESTQPAKTEQANTVEDKSVKVEASNTTQQEPKPASTESMPKQEGQPDDKFINKLLQAIQNANEEGFDYLEFKQALQNLNNVSMDESTRYQSALAMAQTMGSDGSSLLASANRYLKVIENEEVKFREAFEMQMQAKVQAREGNINSLRDGIEMRKKKIEELQSEISQMEEKLKQVETDSDGVQTKFNATKQGFYNSYHVLVNQIKHDIDMIGKAN